MIGLKVENTKEMKIAHLNQNKECKTHKGKTNNIGRKEKQRKIRNRCKLMGDSNKNSLEEKNTLLMDEN